MTKVQYHQLTRSFDSLSQPETPKRYVPEAGIVGQDRAVAALHLGLGISNSGFNIFVAGPNGIGKMTAVKSFLEELAAAKPAPEDVCYVNNFDDPTQPRALLLPAGNGRQLQKDVSQLIEQIRREIPKSFESEDYLAKREDIIKDLEHLRSQIIEEINAGAASAGFFLQVTPTGVLMIPVKDGNTLKDKEFESLPEEEKKSYLKRREALQENLKQSLKKIRDIDKKYQQRIEEADQNVVQYILGGRIEDLVEKYADFPEVVQYLKEVESDILKNREVFKSKEAPAQAIMINPQWLTETPFRKYQVNVIVDNEKRKGAPVVIEMNPVYGNLFGRLEKEMQLGAMSTDFTLIKAGSFHYANGGYLVLQIEEVLRNLFSWDAIKRTLRSGMIEIEEPAERFGFLSTKGLRPEPIKLHVKVVLIGSPILYYLLNAYDSEFSELFKVKADFDTRMPATAENISSYSNFLGYFCEKNQLKKLDQGSIGEILKYSARLSEDQDKLSTHFGLIVDLLWESSHYAQQEKAETITALHVKKAIESKIYRSNLIEKRIQDLIQEGTILIDVKGKVAGQINGLSVITVGDYFFGRPNKITATTAPGRERIVDIEKEVKLGGPFHSKGILILSGYLSARYAQDHPLSVSAKLVFEQSYEGIDGDSASSAELYALLSSLSGVPIDQGIAVTGSVNQRGQLQAIGGVNQKIEGFFDVCNATGLTGNQGVIIPKSNLRNLMLREDVIKAVKDEKFHVWAAETIDEGLEILTGRPAGKLFDGRYEPGSINDLVQNRLHTFAKLLRESEAPRGFEKLT